MSQDDTDLKSTAEAGQLERPVSVITVVIRPYINRVGGYERVDVESLCFDEAGLPILGKNGIGEDYHLGQISSSIGWARHDMIEHFKHEYDRIYPNGWAVVFDC